MNIKMKNKVLQPIFIDIMWGFLYFPIWWYSKGLLMTLRFCFGRIGDYWRTRGFAISFKFIFKPMYLQNDFWGRVISFFIRFIVLIFKLILFLFVFVIFMAILLLWVFLPLIALYKIFINISNL
jgi:hypothetical protein